MSRHTACDSNDFIQTMTGVSACRLKKRPLDLACALPRLPVQSPELKLGARLLYEGASFKKRLDFQFLTHSHYFDRVQPDAFPSQVRDGPRCDAF